MGLRIFWSAASVARIWLMAAIVFTAHARDGFVRASGGGGGGGGEGGRGLNSGGAMPARSVAMRGLEVRE